MAALLDAVMFTPTLGGTTDWVVSANVQGYQTPALANAVNARIYKYRAESADLSQWEEGEGVYTVGSVTLARTTVFYNSAGTGTLQSGAGTKINFSTVPSVMVVQSKHDTLAIEEANSFTAAQRNQARQNIAVYTGDLEIIINKSVQVDQTWEGNTANADGSNNPHPGASRVTETYGPDNWRLGADIGTGNFTGQRALLGSVPNSPGTWLLCTTTVIDATPAAGNHYHVEIPVEGNRIPQIGFGTSFAQPFTVQFWYSSNANGLRALAAAEGNTNSLTCVKTFNYTASPGVPQFFTLTFPAITTGSWSIAAATIGLKFLFDLGSGSNFETASPDVWNSGFFLRTAACVHDISTLSRQALFTNFQCDVGNVALPFRNVSYAQDLFECQRLYYKTFDDGVAVAQNAGANGAHEYVSQIVGSSGVGFTAGMRFPAAMAQVPAITTFNTSAANAKWRNQTAALDSGTPIIFNPGKRGVSVHNPHVAGDGANALMSIHVVANARLGGF